jgi:hypothetical protein
MNRATRQQVTRRSVALNRLESITTGAAIAGVAGTIGFGALAAITFSGTANAANVTDGQSGSNVQIDRSGRSDDQVIVPAPNTNDDGGIAPNTNNDSGTQPFVVAPAPQTSTRHSHATTGGSG